MAGKEEHEAGDLMARATRAYQSGDSRQALQLLDEGIAVLPADAVTARALILVQKAQWLRENGYPEDGAKTLDETVRELDRLPRAGHEMVWQGVRTEQGVVATSRGDFKAAEAFLAEAATLAQQSPLRDLQLPDVYANQASLYMYQGQLSRAQDVLLAALEIDQRVGNKRSESNDLNMLGLVYGSLGDTETSRVYLEKAFKVAYDAGLTREATDAMTNLAALMDDAGDHEGAAEIFRNIGRTRADGGDESAVACSIANQGVAAAMAGDLDRAVTLLTRSHELHKEVGNWLHSVQDLLNLSNAEAARDRYDQALSYAEQALAGAHEYGLIELLWTAEYAVATCRLSVAAGSADAESAIAAFEEALAGYRRAADVVELLRSNVDRPEERESLLAGKEGLYDKTISLCAGLGRPRDAFQFCERARMRSFIDALGSSRVEQLEEDDPGAERHAQLVARLLSPGTQPDEKPGLLDELRIMRAEKAARRPALAAITEAELPTEDDIRAAIPPETCVLEYFQIGNSVFVFLLDQDGLKDSGVVTPPEPLEAIVSRFNDEIEDGNPELKAGSLLFAALLGPFMSKLAETEDLIVVPHRSLHYVPFSALWYEHESDDEPSRRYLRTRFNLTTVPSASYLPYLSRIAAPEREYGPPVVLGNPTGDLDGADLEARRVAAKLQVTARLGVSATRAALLGAGAAAVVHVASHGQYSEEDPLLSGLALADGVVTVEDLLGSGPAPRLLVLSGCVTGKSKRRPGDELIGLAQAALRSGTRSVVATLWETFDESSTLFFEHFYESLMEGGATVSQAITWARDALATGPGGYSQPVDWAPFLLIGDPAQRLVEPDQTPMAQFNRGVDLVGQGDEEGARNIFEHVASSGSPTAAGRAAFSLGFLLKRQGDTGGAQQVWQHAADSGDPEVAPLAMWSLGGLLEDQGDVEGARAAYQHATDSGHPDVAPQAMVSAGNLLRDQGDIESARTAYQRAIDSGHPLAAAKGNINLGSLLCGQGDIEGARAAYQRAIDGGHSEEAPIAIVALGDLLRDQEDLEGARAAYQRAIDSGHPEAVAKGAIHLGNLLRDQGDIEGAHANYQRAIDRGDEEDAPVAAVALGTMLAKHGDFANARPALQTAIDSGHPRARAEGAYNLGVMLNEQEDFAGAIAAYRLAAQSGHADHARRADALVNLGVLLATRFDPPDLPAARAAFEQAAASGDAHAAYNLGKLLADQLDPPDLPGARAAYEQAAAAGHTSAAYNLGMLLATQLDPPDLPGARAAFEQAAAAGDTDALIGLGSVEAELGRVPEASAAWRAAVDSGVDEAIVPAALNLAALAAASGDLASARALLQRAADAGASGVGDYRAVLEPTTRAAACAQLAELPNTHSLNFRGIAALIIGDQAAARRLWTVSRDQHDAAAPLLLQLIATP